MLRPLPALSLGIIFIIGVFGHCLIATRFDRGAFLAAMGEASDKYRLSGFAVTFMRQSALVTEAAAARLTGTAQQARLDLAAERGLVAAQWLLDEGNVTAARQIERRLSRVAPWRADVRFFQYEILLAQGRNDDARKDLFEAVLDGDEPEAAYLLGMSFIAEGKEMDGAQYLAHALNRQADHYRANLALGQHYVRVGERTKAHERGVSALSAARNYDERLAAYALLGQAGEDPARLLRWRVGDVARTYGPSVLVLLIYLALLPLPWIVRTAVRVLHIPVGRFARRKVAAAVARVGGRG